MSVMIGFEPGYFFVAAGYNMVSIAVFSRLMYAIGSSRLLVRVEI